MSTIAPSILASATRSDARLAERLLNLKQGLHRAYCLAVCLDRAMRYNDTDNSPELAVCVHEYLVRPLDALSNEADELRRVFETALVMEAEAPTKSDEDMNE